MTPMVHSLWGVLPCVVIVAAACGSAAPPPAPAAPAAEAAVPVVPAPAITSMHQPADGSRQSRVPRGRVRLDGRAFVDDGGPRPALGASLFWLAWGYRHDRDRVDRNLRWLAERGVDFVRAFAEVCGDTWSDREVRPDWNDYAETLRGSTRLAMQHGLRVEWTLFAGGCYDSPPGWLAAADTMIEALRPVVDGVQFVEVTNEEQLPDRQVVREIAGRVREQLKVEVALTGTPAHALPPIYAGSAATVATVHFDRSGGDRGWLTARRSWDYWGLPDMPPAFVNNEPAGIDGSVREENDPVKLASDALVTWLAGGAAYVLHHGAGIYGRDYVRPGVGHRFANVWEQPTAEDALRLITRVRDALPPDVANWTRADNLGAPSQPSPPFRFSRDQINTGALRERGLVRAFTAQRNGEFCTVILGAHGEIAAEPTRPVAATVRDLREWVARPWTGRLVGTDSAYLVQGRETR
jgi:hypothetical protein